MGVRRDGDIRAFAALLRELKERSGRSFEALATRTGVSRSALHRYCSGRGVPVDYVVVDRFARHCAADRADLLELYRLWVLADAARQRREPPAGKERFTGETRVPAPVSGADRDRRAWGLPPRIVTALGIVAALTVLGAVRTWAARSGATTVRGRGAGGGPATGGP